MQIQISNSDEFHRLLSGLVDELVQAEIHFKLYQDLNAVRSEYAREFRQSSTFWWLTFRAHLDAVLLRLCRAYDQHARGSPSLNLRNLLDTIDTNLHLFNERNFRERLKGNSFVDSMAETSRTPDRAQLKRDIQSVSDSDPVVKKLIIWRNNVYAHRSADHVLDTNGFEEEHPLSFSDIEALLANGVSIVNRYSDLFDATHHSTDIVGRDDYHQTLEAVRQALDAHEAQIREEMRRLSTTGTKG